MGCASVTAGAVFMGSFLSHLRSNQDIKISIHFTGKPEQHHRCRIHLCDDRWAWQTIAGAQLGAIVDRRRKKLAVEVDAMFVTQGVLSRRAVEFSFGECK